MLSLYLSLRCVINPSSYLLLYFQQRDIFSSILYNYKKPYIIIPVVILIHTQCSILCFASYCIMFVSFFVSFGIIFLSIFQYLISCRPAHHELLQFLYVKNILYFLCLWKIFFPGINSEVVLVVCLWFVSTLKVWPPALF